MVEVNGTVTIDDLKREGKQFVFVSKAPANDKDSALEELTNKYGLKRKLIMQTKSYQLQGYNVGLYNIEDVGKFLILTGDDPTLEMLKEWFGIDAPKVVTVSFDNL